MTKLELIVSATILGVLIGIVFGSLLKLQQLRSLEQNCAAYGGYWTTYNDKLSACWYGYQKYESYTTK